MRVSPAPDVVIRVFMLFRGVHSDNVGAWASAAARATAEDGATFWTKVVGVDAVRALIARCSACWSGAGSKLSNLRIAGTCPSSLPSFLWVMR